MSDHAIPIRPARAEDQPAITRIVRAARIYPFGLHWRRFLVAEVGGQIAGVVQMRRHGDGSRELASVATEPAFQRRGIAAALIREWLAREPGAVYLTCRAPLETFYARFGFRRAQMPDVPRSMLLSHLMGRMWGGLVMVRGEHKQR